VNLLVIEAAEKLDDGLACVQGRKAQHLREVLGKGVGDRIRVGELGGLVGEGVIERVEPGSAFVRYTVSEAPPPPSPVRLVLALPRPPMLRRILLHATTLGVKRIVLVHTARVEKSFWGSHALRADAIAEQLQLGLEQARDTVLPTVALQRRFRPFVEDELAGWDGRKLVAQPDAVAEPEAGAEPTGSEAPTTVVVGPEGGLVPFELALLRAAGFMAVSLGPRILRVETAVVVLVARLSRA
jgi:16S rRNA (uracil1498-N3)-methyltransferase